MKKNLIKCCCALALCGLLVSPAVAGEKIDNPQYKHWAQFKVGSFAKCKMVQNVEAGGMKMETTTTTTTTLKKLSAEKAVIEIEMVTVANGQEMKMPATTQDIPAKIDKPKPEETKPPKDKPKTKQGKEVLDIAGKKIKTEWTESTMKHAQTTVTTKMWMSEEIPGQMVKMKVNTSGEAKMVSETILIKFKADKK